MSRRRTLSGGGDGKFELLGNEGMQPLSLARRSDMWAWVFIYATRVLREAVQSNIRGT